MSLCMRLPVPAAGITAQTGALLLRIGAITLLRNQLNKGFSLLDHAEIVAGFLFKSIQAVLQVKHLRFE